MALLELTVPSGRATGVGRLAAGGGGGGAAAGVEASSAQASAGAVDFAATGALPNPEAGEEPKAGLGTLGTDGFGAVAVASALIAAISTFPTGL